MPKFESNRVINGTWGEMWVNDLYLAEVEEGKAEIDLTYSDVSMVRTLTPGKKLTKIEPKGSVKLHHVRSNIAKEVADSVQQGKSPTYKIIMKLEDPDAFGAERVALYGCKGSPPRMRENLEGHGAGRQIAESPPRMRGKPGP